MRLIAQLEALRFGDESINSKKLGLKNLFTSIFSRIVAPSLVTMTCPSGLNIKNKSVSLHKLISTYLTSILSIPLGPSDVFMRLATVLAAIMLI